jgi:DNA-binding NarL/FixJ family response regulator
MRENPHELEYRGSTPSMRLSPRGFQITQPRAKGESRGSVAKKLGLTANIIGTISERIHKTLGA